MCKLKLSSLRVCMNGQMLYSSITVNTSMAIMARLLEQGVSVIFNQFFLPVQPARQTEVNSLSVVQKPTYFGAKLIIFGILQ